MAHYLVGRLTDDRAFALVLDFTKYTSHTQTQLFLYFGSASWEVCNMLELLI